METQKQFRLPYPQLRCNVSTTRGRIRDILPVEFKNTGIWEFEDRAIGFYSSFLAVASVIVFLYFAISMSPGGEFSDYSEGLWLSMSAVPLVLTVISTITFFYLGFQFQLLRLVSGWFTLLGSIVIGLIGLGVVATAIA